MTTHTHTHIHIPTHTLATGNDCNIPPSHAQRRGVLKIETIGDAVIIASGVPDDVPLAKSARLIAKVALDMMAAVSTFDKALGDKLKGHKLAARIGIHCGSVLAGVVGDDMPRYQLCGKTMDEVQALESSSEPGRVHASAEILPFLVNVIGSSAASREVSEIKVDSKLPDGSAFVLRDRTGTLSGVAW